MDNHPHPTSWSSSYTTTPIQLHSTSPQSFRNLCQDHLRSISFLLTYTSGQIIDHSR